jgi:hypothetical protein
MELLCNLKSLHRGTYPCTKEMMLPVSSMVCHKGDPLLPWGRDGSARPRLVSVLCAVRHSCGFRSGAHGPTRPSFGLLRQYPVRPHRLLTRHLWFSNGDSGLGAIVLVQPIGLASSACTCPPTPTPSSPTSNISERSTERYRRRLAKMLSINSKVRYAHTHTFHPFVLLR